jgi:hypothetical protein
MERLACAGDRILVAVWLGVNRVTRYGCSPRDLSRGAAARRGPALLARVKASPTRCRGSWHLQACLEVLSSGPNADCNAFNEIPTLSVSRDVESDCSP